MIVLDYWFYRTYTLFSSKKRKMDPVIENIISLSWYHGRVYCSYSRFAKG